MEDFNILTTLGIALYVVGWICAAGAFFDLAVIRPLLRFYTSSIELAESRGKFFNAAQLRLMHAFLQRLEQVVSFITCWQLVKLGGGTLLSRMAGGPGR